MQTKNVVGLLAVLFLLMTTSRVVAYVDGIDISHWQGTVNWSSIKSSGVEFAFVKATDGDTFVDSKFSGNMAGANTSGVMIGPYHFARVDNINGVPVTTYDGSPFLPGTGPHDDAVNEAQHFLNTIQPYYDTGLYLPPVADVEGLPDFGSSGLNKTYVSNWVQVFSDTIDNSLGRRPLIYTSKYGANTRYTPQVAQSHDLWLAWWKGTGTTNPPVSADTPIWNDWKFWQYSATGSVPGISGNVDLDVFDGTLTELADFRIGTDAGPIDPGPIVSITDFETDEGYFNWPTDFSGSNQGIGNGSHAVRVTTEAHGGIGSQEIYIEGDPGSWYYRHLSGSSSPVASPVSNLPMDVTGSLGFWLKTDDAGVTVQIAVDDPSTGDRGVSQAVIADGEWHLYEWDLGDDSQWEAWINEEGIITGPTVTIDSIQFRGAGDATLYLDSVAHNSEGSLLPIEGDFDGNGRVDDADLSEWEEEFGTTGGYDGGDLLNWQRNFSPAGSAASTTAVPEPGSFALIAAALICCMRTQNRRHSATSSSSR